MASKGGPVLGVLVIPHGVDKPQTFSRAERPRCVDDFLKRGHGHPLSVTGFPAAGTKSINTSVSMSAVASTSAGHAALGRLTETAGVDLGIGDVGPIADQPEFIPEQLWATAYEAIVFVRPLDHFHVSVAFRHWFTLLRALRTAFY
jgi:hypothetical protein